MPDCIPRLATRPDAYLPHLARPIALLTVAASFSSFRSRSPTAALYITTLTTLRSIPPFLSVDGS